MNNKVSLHVRIWLVLNLCSLSCWARKAVISLPNSMGNRLLWCKYKGILQDVWRRRFWGHHDVTTLANHMWRHSRTLPTISSVLIPRLFFPLSHPLCILNCFKKTPQLLNTLPGLSGFHTHSRLLPNSDQNMSPTHKSCKQELETVSYYINIFSNIYYELYMF